MLRKQLKEVNISNVATLFQTEEFTLFACESKNIWRRVVERPMYSLFMCSVSRSCLQVFADHINHYYQFHELLSSSQAIMLCIYVGYFCIIFYRQYFRNAFWLKKYILLMQYFTSLSPNHQSVSTHFSKGGKKQGILETTINHMK